MWLQIAFGIIAVYIIGMALCFIGSFFMRLAEKSWDKSVQKDWERTRNAQLTARHPS